KPYRARGRARQPPVLPFYCAARLAALFHFSVPDRSEEIGMINCVLVGPPQEGGEGVYVKEVFENPPDEVSYYLSQEFHAGNERARCNVFQEVLLNRTVYPFLRYSFGFRVLS